MTTLWVTRHGETDFNLQNRYAGSSDILLNDTGLKQAQTLAENSSGFEVDVIVSSPLLRALQTALVVQRASGKPLHVVQEFAERNMGIYEGLTRAEARERHPELWNLLSTRPDNLAPTGGETLRELAARVQKGLAYLRGNYDGKSILLVAHGAVSMEINRALLGLSFEEMHDFRLGNCEVASYQLA